MNQKLGYTGHVMRGSTGLNALQVPEGKFDEKKGRGRPRRTMTDNVIQWMPKKNYDEVKDWLRTGTREER